MFLTYKDNIRITTGPTFTTWFHIFWCSIFQLYNSHLYTKKIFSVISFYAYCLREKKKTITDHILYDTIEPSYSEIFLNQTSVMPNVLFGMYTYLALRGYICKDFNIRDKV